MIPIRLSVVGHKGFRAYGEGVEFDFSIFGPGLVALVGPNGAGKTSFIECLNPFRAVFSRPGVLSDAFYLDDSRRRFEFEYAGARYISDIRVNAKSGKTEAYLLREDQPVPGTDGKTRTYDAAVMELFGHESLFRRSVFSEQGGGKISDLAPADAKALFSDLCGHQKYSRYTDRARAHIKETEAALYNIGGKIAAVEENCRADKEKLAAKEEIAVAVTFLDEKIVTVEMEIEKLAEKIKAAAVEKERREQLMNQLVPLENELQGLKADKVSLEGAQANLKADIDTQFGTLESDIKELEAKLNQADYIRASREKLENLRTENEKLIEMASQLAELEKQKAQLKLRILEEGQPVRDKIVSLEKEEAALGAKIEREKAAELAALESRRGELALALEREKAGYKKRCNDLNIDRVDLEHKIKLESQSLQNSIEKINLNIESSKNIYRHIEEVPCKDLPEFVSTCPLLETAREAQNVLPKLEKTVAELTKREEMDHPLQARWNEITSEMRELEIHPPEPESQKGYREILDQIDVFGLYVHPEQERLQQIKNEIFGLMFDPPPTPSQGELDAICAQIAGISHDEERHLQVKADICRLCGTDWKKLSDELEKASAGIAEKQSKIESLRERLARERAEYATRISAAAEKISDKELAYQTLSERIGAIVMTDMAALEGNLRDAKTILVNQTKWREIKKGELAALARLEEEIVLQEGRLTALSGERDKIIRELAEWKFLEGACSLRGGIPALKLDASGPQISEVATEILREYGRDWLINLVTTRESADGKRELETFDVLISRPEGTESVAKFSGGEKLLVDHCLRQAITIYLRRQSGRDYRCACYDESDGAFDEGAAQAFLRALYKAHWLSGATYTFLITHRPHLWMSIPQRIHFMPEEGKLEIVSLQ